MAEEHGRASENVGAHLLGRKAHPAETGDFSLEKHLAEAGQIPNVGELATYLADAIAALQPFAVIPIVSKILPMLQDLQQLLDRFVPSKGKQALDPASIVAEIQDVIDALIPFASSPLVEVLVSLLEDVIAAIDPHPAPPSSPPPSTPAPSSPPPTSPPPSPGPAPAAQSMVWADPTVLDQGQTGHCIGFGGAGYLVAEPIQDAGIDDAFGHALYYDCKILDGEPGREDGSTVHTLARELVKRARIGKYAWASTVGAMKQWVLQSGTIVMGTDWDNDMFDPDPDGFVKPGGGVAGGHCYLMVGYHADLDAFEFINSWSTDWGKDGHFFMKTAALTTLWHRSGNEAMVTLELPL